MVLLCTFVAYDQIVHSLVGESVEKKCSKVKTFVISIKICILHKHDLIIMKIKLVYCSWLNIYSFFINIILFFFI